MTDDDLIKLYMKGFNDELDGIFDSNNNNKAYQLGLSHAIMGDDISCVDYLTTDEILKMIKV